MGGYGARTISDLKPFLFLTIVKNQIRESRHWFSLLIRSGL